LYANAQVKYKSSYDAENDKFHGDGSFMGQFPVP
jgi:hypothetical protein